jgi:pyridoxal phosphate enzyme (YggS family)
VDNQPPSDPGRAARIRERVERLHSELSALAGTDWRSRITVVAVTKTAVPGDVEAASAAGLAHFGENRVQELARKVRALRQLPASWHMVGHLQTNKVKPALELATLIHSVDSVRLALEIDRAAARLGRTVPVLLQVNVAGETTKGGFSPADVGPALDHLAGCARERPLAISIAGLMTMAPYTSDEGAVRRVFRELARLRDRLAARGDPFCNPGHLSMGMSGDYRIAVQEGSTMLRIGTLLFGERD